MPLKLREWLNLSITLLDTLVYSCGLRDSGNRVRFMFTPPQLQFNGKYAADHTSAKVEFQ